MIVYVVTTHEHDTNKFEVDSVHGEREAADKRVEEFIKGVTPWKFSVGIDEMELK